MKLKFLVLFCVFGVVLALITFKIATSQTSLTNPTFSSSDLIKQAVKDNKPAWLLFHSKTCQTCIEMERTYETLRPEFAGKIAFINIDVNNPSEKTLVKLYKINQIPTSYFLNRAGQPISLDIGLIPMAEMQSKLGALAGGK